MCEYIDEKTPIHGFAANGDIVCYKLIIAHPYAYCCYVSSICYAHVWYAGQTYKTDLKYHSEYPVYECIGYNQTTKMWERWNTENGSPYRSEDIRTFLRTDLARTGKGFYSYSRYMSERMEKDAVHYKEYIRSTPNILVIGRFVIPKGSRYYVNDDASVYISNALRFDGIVGEYTENQ
jgi:hypothetical protein